MNNDVGGQQVFEVDNPVLFSVQKYQRNTQCLGNTNRLPQTSFSLSFRRILSVCKSKSCVI